MSEEKQEKYADKINKLLAKAESTTPAEAEALVEKAQQLMAEYAIDEAMLARAQGLEDAEKVVEERVTYRGIFGMACFDIGREVAKANDCRHFIDKHSVRNGVQLVIIGFERDVARVKLLDTSLQIQGVGARVRWEKSEEGKAQKELTNGGMPWYKARREFVMGFAMGIGQKLEAGARAGRKNAKEKYEAKGSSSNSVELVLRDKKARVDDWIDREYGKLRTVSRRYSSGGYGARRAGHAAGLKADVSGDNTVRGNQRSLPS